MYYPNINHNKLNVVKFFRVDSKLLGKKKENMKTCHFSHMEKL